MTESDYATSLDDSLLLSVLHEECRRDERAALDRLTAKFEAAVAEVRVLSARNALLEQLNHSQGATISTFQARITELEAETRQWDAAHEEQWERAERAEALRDRAQLDRDAAEVRANRAEAALAELDKILVPDPERGHGAFRWVSRG